MTEYIVRAAGPAVVVVVEVEGPVRVFSTANGDADRAALEAWIGSSDFRGEAVAAALAARDAGGGERRGRRWARTLRSDGRGIVAALERVLSDR